MPSMLTEALTLLCACYSLPQYVRASPRAAAAFGRSMGVSRHVKMSRQRSIRGEISPRCLSTLVAAANENGKLKKENYFIFTDGMSNGYYTYYNMTSFSDLPFQNKYGFIILACQCSKQGGSDNCCQGERAKLDVSGVIDNPEGFDDELHAYVVDICRVTMASIGEDVLPATGELELPATPDPVGSPAPSDGPTSAISTSPSGSPSGSAGPSGGPSSSGRPSGSPSSSGWPTGSPSITAFPTGAPSNWPSSLPIQSPTSSPTEAPTDSPTISPMNAPITASPTVVRPLPVAETPVQSLPTDSPVVSPTDSPITASPTIMRPLPVVETPVKDPGDQDDRKEGGLSSGVWAGIAAAGAFVLLAVLLLCCFRKKANKDLGAVPPQRGGGGTGGGMLAITNGGVGDGTASNTLDVEKGTPISEGRQGRAGSTDGNDSITASSASSTVSSLPSEGHLAHVGIGGSAVASQSGRQGRAGSTDGNDSITAASASSTVSSLPSEGPLAHVGMGGSAVASQSGRQGHAGSTDESNSITTASASSTVSSLPSEGPLAHVGMGGSAVASQSRIAVENRGGRDLDQAATASGTFSVMPQCRMEEGRAPGRSQVEHRSHLRAAGTTPGPDDEDDNDDDDNLSDFSNPFGDVWKFSSGTGESTPQSKNPPVLVQDYSGHLRLERTIEEEDWEGVFAQAIEDIAHDDDDGVYEAIDDDEVREAWGTTSGRSGAPTFA